MAIKKRSPRWGEGAAAEGGGRGAAHTGSHEVRGTKYARPEGVCT